MEGKHRAGPRRGVEAIGETRFHAGGLVRERQRIAPARQAGWQTLGVFVGLSFYAAEGDAFFLGFDHAGGLAIHIQQIVGKAMAGEREFADRHAARGMDVGGGCIADEPACRLQQSDDILTGSGFWRHYLMIGFSAS